MGREVWKLRILKQKLRNLVILLVLVCDLVGVWCQKYHSVHKTNFSLKSDTYSPDLSVIILSWQEAMELMVL